MKTARLITITAACAGLICSCKSGEEMQPVQQYPVFSAATEAATKTTLNGLTPVFSQGEQIYVSDGFATAVYKTDSEGSTGVTVSYLSGDQLASEGVTYTAYYPASMVSGSTLSLPGSKTSYVPGTLDNPMTATSSTLTLTFSNLCGALAVNLKGGAAVESVSLSADQGLAGEFTVNSGRAELSSETAVKTISCTLAKPDTLTAEDSTAFYFNIPEGDYTNMKVTVNCTGGTVKTFTAKSAISIVRSQLTSFNLTVPASPKAYKLDLSKYTLDDEFDKCMVQKVMCGETQVAELDREYILTSDTSDASYDGRLTVIYPMTSDGKADLTKGVDIATGGSVVWKKGTAGTNAKDTVSYTTGEGKLSAVYILEDGSIALSTTITDITELTLTPDLFVDKRGTNETNTYRTVKIGMQYWMAENLKALYSAEGKKMNYPASVNYFSVGGWAYGQDDLGDNDKNEVLYDGFVATDNFYYGSAQTTQLTIAPAGWKVPAKTDFTRLKSYLGSDTGHKLKDESYESTAKVNSNITGFGAKGTGYYSNSSTWNSTAIYYWTGTSYDTMDTKLYAFYFKPAGAGITSGSLQYKCGAYIRLMRE